MASNSKNNNDASSLLFSIVKGIARKRVTPWTGTMTQLKTAIVNFQINNKKAVSGLYWPASPSALRVALNTVVNRLRNAGVSIRFNRSSDHTRTRLVEFYNNR